MKHIKLFEEIEIWGLRNKKTQKDALNYIQEIEYILSDESVSISINFISEKFYALKIFHNDQNLSIWKFETSDEFAEFIDRLRDRFKVQYWISGKSIIVHLTNGELTITD